MTRVPRLRENREYRGTGERVVFHRVTGRVAATQKAEQSGRQKGEAEDKYSVRWTITV